MPITERRLCEFSPALGDRRRFLTLPEKKVVHFTGIFNRHFTMNPAVRAKKWLVFVTKHVKLYSNITDSLTERGIDDLVYNKNRAF